jgi:predicted nucleic acid-binding protein
MKVLIDTSAWLSAFQPGEGDDFEVPRKIIGKLITENRIVLIRPIQQEILSAVEATQRELLLEPFLSFLYVELEPADYKAAAIASERCRKRNIFGPGRDFLTCAVTLRRKIEIYSTDSDFANYARIIRNLKLYDDRN